MERESTVSALLFGIAGAVASYFVVRHLRNKLRRGAADGTLGFGPQLMGLGMLLLMLALVLGGVLVFEAGASERIGLWVAGFAALAGGVYCCIEASQTRGVVDDSGILFHSLWGGDRDELWRDLRSVKYSALTRCYVLTFKSGRKMRISVFLSGHGAVLDALRQRGMWPLSARR